MQKKLIFFIKDFIVGGVEQILVTTVNELQKQGNEVLIVWTGFLEQNHLYQQIDPHIKQLNTNDLWHLVGEKKPSSPFKKILYALKRNLNLYLLKDISKHIPNFETYDCLIDFKNGSSKVWRIKTLPHQKKFVWVHGAFSRFFKKNKFKTYRLLDYNNLICLTESFKRQTIQHFPAAKEKVVVIRNPFDIPAIVRKSKEAEPQLKQYRPYFLHVSRISADKDIQTMLNAYKIFYEKTKSPINLVFIGHGELFDFYRQQVQTSGLQNKIHFLGNQSNPFCWMKNAEALILCSFNEGLPTVLIEGQICRTLVIASNCEDGPDEILENGKCGILFEPCNAEQLAQILEKYHNQKINKEQYIQNADKHIKNFDKATFVQKVQNLINKE